MIAFSLTGRGKRPLQAHAKSHDDLFLDRQGEKAIARGQTLHTTPSEKGHAGRSKASKTRVLSLKVPFSLCWSRKRQSG